MEDLSSLGFTQTSKSANNPQIKTVLKWLSNFHAKYINVKSELLWETGTYWHLDTRPDELEALENIELKIYAKTIDDILKNSKYQTIVHGDAKLANFCFNKEATKCAAVDFQYVGHGCAMKDVALFISSAVESEKLKESETWLLDFYFSELKLSLNTYNSNLNFDEIKKEWEEMYYFAWADFVRFLKGWSPNHFKINDYSQDITNEVLKKLKKATSKN